eukprot:gnl/TRDRNA2_/TRDRNA2_29235_c0_seq2.p1 gnl/TRDRNA2_/TRDRNA2_29235_c0~~gnl/TRDRNA2_/TRDRNA2_29235_c0_seq2.p1  ORF type:complete len:269 (+),score=42.06 gnl/TRDRNA2_/TRDRNA2_29235_c0_seq2:95-901(+)
MSLAEPLLHNEIARSPHRRQRAVLAVVFSSCCGLLLNRMASLDHEALLAVDGPAITMQLPTTRAWRHRQPAAAWQMPRRPPEEVRLPTSARATRADIAGAEARLLAATVAAGPVGVDASDEQQAQVEAAAVALSGLGASQPAQVPLAGEYDLLFSMSKGGSNGKIGPLTGQVSQIIVDDENFINQVSLFGGMLIAQLYAKRKVMDEKRIKVSFVETVFKLFGKEVKRQPTKGQGVWENLFVEPGTDGRTAGLRVMRTPSLFVLKQRTL